MSLLVAGAIAGAALGGLAAGLGSHSKRRKAKKMRRAMEEKRRENEAWYNKNYYADATQRADAQRALQRLNQDIQNRNARAAGAQAVTGGTEEAVAATKQANAEAIGNALSNITTNAEARKGKIEEQFRTADSAYSDQIAALKAQEPSGLDIAGNVIGGMANGAQAGMGLADGLGAGKKKAPTT